MKCTSKKTVVGPNDANLLGRFWGNIGCMFLGKSENESLIQDHLDHGASEEPKNPFPAWIHRFL